MPIGRLPDPKHEEFAQAMAFGETQAEAARQAGSRAKQAYNQGSRLAKRPEVRERIQELTAVNRNSTGSAFFTSREWIVLQTARLHRHAFAQKQYSVNLSCLQFLAKLGGHLVDRRESYSECVKSYTASPEITSALRGHLQQLPEAERAALQAESPEIIEVLADDPSTVQGSE